jgi:DNA processing protein
MNIAQLKVGSFPIQLQQIPQPPEKLWLRGALPPPETKFLAVVGSRALTTYGREACEYLVGGLAGYPISIVSGLALGADACAHRAALDAGLHTIAIPASGLADEAIGPRSNFGLAMDILSAGGMLVSEHEPMYQPHKGDFPARNRLMVGLAHAVLVIEAGERSGTLITARLTADYNRELLCVPHRIGDPHSAAAHIFLRLGATLAAEPAHILEALGLEQHKAAVGALANLSPSEQLVLDLLIEPLSRDDVIRQAKLPPHETLSILGTLELKGVLKERFGLWRRI